MKFENPDSDLETWIKPKYWSDPISSKCAESCRIRVLKSGSSTLLIPMNYMAWQFWTIRQLNGCSTPSPRSSAAKQWFQPLAQKKKTNRLLWSKNYLKCESVPSTFLKKRFVDFMNKKQNCMELFLCEENLSKFCKCWFSKKFCQLVPKNAPLLSGWKEHCFSTQSLLHHWTHMTHVWVRKIPSLQLKSALLS